jgi:hypothetical protein
VVPHQVCRRSHAVAGWLVVVHAVPARPAVADLLRGNAARPCGPGHAPFRPLRRVRHAPWRSAVTGPVLGTQDAYGSRFGMAASIHGRRAAPRHSPARPARPRRQPPRPHRRSDQIAGRPRQLRPATRRVRATPRRREAAHQAHRPPQPRTAGITTTPRSHTKIRLAQTCSTGSRWPGIRRAARTRSGLRPRAHAHKHRATTTRTTDQPEP